MKSPRALGNQLIAVWLLIWGINAFMPTSIVAALLGVLAIVAALLILSGR